MSRKGNNIYQRKDGRFEGRLKYSKDGKEKYKSFYGSSYEEVLKILETEKEKLPAPITPTMEYIDCTVEEACERWLKKKQKEISSSSYAQYDFKVKKHLVRNLGNLKISELARADVEQNFKNYLMTQRIGPGTRDAIMQMYRSILKFSSIDGEESLPKKKHDRPKNIEVMTEREKEALTTFLKEEADVSKIGILCAFRLGLRIGEICALKWGDISFDRMEMLVNKTATGIQDNVDCIKERIIPIPKDVAECLFLLRDSSDKYIISGLNDKPGVKRTMEMKLDRYCKKAGIEKKTFSMLRDSFIINALISKKMDLRVIAYIIGVSLSELERYVEAIDYPWDMTEMSFQIENLP